MVRGDVCRRAPALTALLGRFRDRRIDRMTDRVARRPHGRRARCGASSNPARGRLAIYTTPPELKGTPAAPYPLATRGHFYEDAELRELALRAGLQEPRVERHGGAQLLLARPY